MLDGHDLPNAAPAQPEPESIERARSFVPVLARRYTGRGMSQDELVAAGNLGLVEAARRFDPLRGVRFTTYAAWWIRKTMLEALGQQTGPLRLPRYQHDRLRAVRHARASWLAHHGTKPTTDELAAEAGLTAEDVVELDVLGHATVSLEQPLGPDDARPVKELLGDPDATAADRQLMDQGLRELLHRRLAELGQRERQVLSLRYGLVDGVALTLRDTGERLGISRERVRQVELRALGKLRRVIG